MASIVAQADLPPEDESWKAEVKKPPRDNRYQTEDVTLTKGRPQALLARASPPPLMSSVLPALPPPSAHRTRFRGLLPQA